VSSTMQSALCIKGRLLQLNESPRLDFRLLPNVTRHRPFSAGPSREVICESAIEFRVVHLCHARLILLRGPVNNNGQDLHSTDPSQASLSAAKAIIPAHTQKANCQSAHEH
jgi:hypothetical protein